MLYAFFVMMYLCFLSAVVPIKPEDEKDLQKQILSLERLIVRIVVDVNLDDMETFSYRFHKVKISLSKY
jgi:hypothetical protein